MVELPLIILILIILEIFEIWWQKAPTIEKVISQTYLYYQKSIFVLFLTHPSFYFVVFIIIYTKILNIWMIAILFIKIIDIFFKLTLIKGLYQDGDIDEKIRIVIKQPLNQWLFLTGLGLYPFLLFYGLI